MKRFVFLISVIFAIFLCAVASAEIASGTWGTCAWDISDDGVLTIHGGIGGDSTGVSPWIDYAESITKIVGREEITLQAYSDYLFDNLSAVKWIDVSGFNTSSVIHMDDMFARCSSLMSVDLSSFDVSNVQSMGNLFWQCSSLQTLDLSCFDTRNVEYMHNMFTGCSSLLTLDLSTWTTSKVMRMESMFSGCSNLTALNIPFDTSNVESMKYMFSGCTSLETLDLSSFSTSSLKWMNYFLYNCKSLSMISFGADFKFGTEVNFPTGRWLSKNTKKEYQYYEITSNRSNIADTYIKMKGFSAVDYTLPDSVIAPPTWEEAKKFTDYVEKIDEESKMIQVRYSPYVLLWLEYDSDEKYSGGTYWISANDGRNYVLTYSGDNKPKEISIVSMSTSPVQSYCQTYFWLDGTVHTVIYTEADYSTPGGDHYDYMRYVWTIDDFSWYEFNTVYRGPVSSLYGSLRKEDARIEGVGLDKCARVVEEPICVTFSSDPFVLYKKSEQQQSIKTYTIPSSIIAPPTLEDAQRVLGNISDGIQISDDVKLTLSYNSSGEYAGGQYVIPDTYTGWAYNISFKAGEQPKEISHWWDLGDEEYWSYWWLDGTLNTTTYLNRNPSDSKGNNVNNYKYFKTMWTIDDFSWYEKNMMYYAYVEHEYDPITQDNYYYSTYYDQVEGHTNPIRVEFGDPLVLWQIPDPELIIPESVTTIESEAFANVVERVFLIPESVESIADDAFDASSIVLVVAGSYAETRCKELGLTVYVVE